jgi:hypothetical protein
MGIIIGPTSQLGNELYETMLVKFFSEWLAYYYY